jgi:hypothetical protein
MSTTKFIKDEPAAPVKTNAIPRPWFERGIRRTGNTLFDRHFHRNHELSEKQFRECELAVMRLFGKINKSALERLRHKLGQGEINEWCARKDLAQNIAEHFGISRVEAINLFGIYYNSDCSYWFQQMSYVNPQDCPFTVLIIFWIESVLQNR